VKGKTGEIQLRKIDDSKFAICKRNPCILRNTAGMGIFRNIGDRNAKN